MALFTKNMRVSAEESSLVEILCRIFQVRNDFDEAMKLNAELISLNVTMCTSFITSSRIPDELYFDKVQEVLP